jgi:adenine phosphoribosyltransferase
MKTEKELKKFIRDIPDFPKKGIIFKDITPLLKDKDAFNSAIELFADRYKDKKIDAIASIEARGFIFGAALSYRLKTGLIPIRKKGKLPYKTVEITYELEYGKDTLEIHEDAVSSGDIILVADDVLATGGTAKAVCNLIEKAGGKVYETAFLIELTFLNGRNKLKDYPIHSLIKF